MNQSDELRAIRQFLVDTVGYAQAAVDAIPDAEIHTKGRRLAIMHGMPDMVGRATPAPQRIEPTPTQGIDELIRLREKADELAMILDVHGFGMQKTVNVENVCAFASQVCSTARAAIARLQTSLNNAPQFKPPPLQIGQRVLYMEERDASEEPVKVYATVEGYVTTSKLVATVQGVSVVPGDPVYEIEIVSPPSREGERVRHVNYWSIVPA